MTQQEPAYRVNGAAAAGRRKEKERRYAAAVAANSSRLRLIPWIVELWGRHDAPLLEFLKGAATIAGRRVGHREACGDEAAEARRDDRVAGSIFRSWQQHLSAGLVKAAAEHFDSLFFPIGGTVARQRGYSRYIPRGMRGSCPLDQGLLGVSGHTRNAEPRFAFAMGFGG